MRKLTPDTITDAVLGQVAATPNLHLKQNSQPALKQQGCQWEPTIRLVRRPA